MDEIEVVEPSPLEAAIEASGGVAIVASALGVSLNAVYKWRNSRLPAERVLALEKLCGRKVTRRQLRPDLYP